MTQNGSTASHVCSVIAAGVGSSDQYQLLKACCSIVSDAVIKQQSLLVRNPQVAAVYGTCMLQFSQAPGIELASIAMSSWKVLFPLLFLLKFALRTSSNNSIKLFAGVARC